MKSKLFISLLLLVSFGMLSSCKSSRERKQKMKTENNLGGSWELNYITAEADLFSFEELYPNHKPTIVFDLRGNQFSGNTSCNDFNGELKMEGNTIDFNVPIGMTRMLCEGQGEAQFLETLKKVNAYSITENNTLALLSGDIAIMRFKRK